MSNQLARLEDHFKPLIPRMDQIIPANANLPAKRIMQSVLLACEAQPKLMECTPLSMQKAVFTACNLGLLVDGVSGQGFILPYGKEAQFQTGFKGYGTIAARSNYMLGGDLVYEGEQYDIVLGSGGHARVRFDPACRKPGAKIIAAFATLESKFAPPLVLAMSLDQILAIRALSKAQRTDSPWNVQFGEMAIKTAKKRLGKSCPVDILQRAAALDDAADSGHVAYIRPEDHALIVDQEAQPLSPMQPPPAVAFSVDESVRYEVIFGDGIVRDLGSLDNWTDQIWKRLCKVGQIAPLQAFLERNATIFTAIAEHHPVAVDALHMKIRERIAELAKDHPA